MKHTRGARLLSMLLTLAMLLSLVPSLSLTAFAATAHNITINNTEHGSVSASVGGSAATSAENGATVTLTATPADGYKLKTISAAGIQDVNETLPSGDYTTKIGSYFKAEGKNWSGRWRVGSSNNGYSLTISSLDASNISKVELTVGGYLGPSNNMNINDLKVSAGTVSTTGIAEGSTVTIDNINNNSVTLTNNNNNSGTSWNFTAVKVYGVAPYTVTLTNTQEGNVKTFAMPDSNVTVSAEFEEDLHNHTLTNYTVTRTNANNDTITAECTADGCSLDVVDGKHIAKLTIAPKDDGTATLTGGADFGVTDEDIQYSIDGGANWNAAPTTSGFLQARVTVNDGSNNYNASIQYGVNSITYATGLAHGTISGVLTGTVGAVITPNVTPDVGYALQQITVAPTSSDSTTTVEKPSDTSFIMPGEAVTVSATFTAIDYTVTVNSAEHGTVTANKTTAHMEDSIEITIQSAAGYVLDTLKYNDGTTDTEVTLNADNKYVFAMPAKNVTVTATFAKLTTYTVFYRASGNPTSVLMRLDNSSEGTSMLKSTKLGDTMSCWEIQVSAKEGLTKLPIAFKEGGGNWSDLTDRDVVSNLSSTISKGNAEVLNGNVNFFLVSFVWGEIENQEYSEYIVTDSTESVAVEDPSKTGYTFLGWDDGKSDSLRTAVNGKVNVSGITKTTILAARWKLKEANVTYNLNGGSGNAPAATVDYGTKIAAPENPARDGYAFVRWIVAKSTTQLVGDKESFISAGTEFNFANTAIINDLELKAEWKHVHSYVCLPLNHAVFGGMLQEYVDAGYGDYIHIKLCTSMDDYCIEAHSFVNGKCACGAVKPNPDATLTKTVGDNTSTTAVKKNSVVSVNAPATSGDNTFARWEYNDGTNWRKLSTNRSAAFVIPADLEVRAVYEAPKAELTLESFDYNGKIAFYLSYKVPSGYTVVDGGILYGNNQHIGYMLAKTSGNDTFDLNIHGVAMYFADVSIVQEPVRYEAAKDDAVTKFGAKKVANKMYMEQALNVSGKSNPMFKSISTLGKAGTAAIAINTSGDNIYYYGMGYVICKAPNGNYVAFATDAISATKANPNNSTTASISVQ